MRKFMWYGFGHCAKISTEAHLKITLMAYFNIQLSNILLLLPFFRFDFGRIYFGLSHSSNCLTILLCRCSTLHPMCFCTYSSLFHCRLGCVKHPIQDDRLRLHWIWPNQTIFTPLNWLLKTFHHRPEHGSIQSF